MHNGLSIYQTKYCKTTFFALLCLSYTLFNRPVVDKTASLRQTSQQSHYYCKTAELQLNLQTHINICCCSFHKLYDEEKKTLLQEIFDLRINSDPMINFDFFLT